jgi:hypothetical protein
MRDEIMLRVAQSFRTAAIAQAEVLAQTPDADDMLLRAVSTLPQSPFPEAMGPLLTALGRMPDRSRGVAALGLATVRSGGCPICGRHFDDSERRELRYKRWMLHGSGPPHVLLFPDDIARFR